MTREHSCFDKQALVFVFTSLLWVVLCLGVHVTAWQEGYNKCMLEHHKFIQGETNGTIHEAQKL